MVVKVEGELITEETSGFGPLKRTHEVRRDFSCVLNTAEAVPVFGELSFRLAPSPVGWVLQGRLKGTQILFGDFTSDGARTLPFSMLSVRGYKLVGSATVVEFNDPK